MKDKKQLKIRYIFTHPDHGTVECTQAELSKNYNINDSSVSNIVLSKRSTAKGWALGSKVKKTSLTYHFTHKDYGTVNHNAAEMGRKYNLGRGAGKLIRGEITNSKGWSLGFEVKESKSGRRFGNSHKLYEFSHPIEGSITCYQVELSKRFNLTTGNISKLVQGKARSTGGWILGSYDLISSNVYNFDNKFKGQIRCSSEEFRFKVGRGYIKKSDWSLSKDQEEVFTFIHKKHGVKVCSQAYMRKEFKLPSSVVSSLSKSNIKSYKGWSVIK